MKQLLLFGLGLIIMLCSCRNVDYLGQKLTPLDDDTEVKIFENLKSMPTDVKVIGRGKILLPDTFIMEDVEDIFAKKARSIGARGVAFTSIRRVLVGMSNEVSNSPRRPQGNWNIDSTRIDGSKVYSSSFGEVDNLNVTQKEYYKNEFKAVFLVPSNEYDELMKDLIKSRNIEVINDQESLVVDENSEDVTVEIIEEQELNESAE